MLGTAAVGLALTYLAVHPHGNGRASQADRRKSARIAREIALEVMNGANTSQLRLIQRLLPNDRLIVVRNGVVVFKGPPRPNRIEQTTTRSLPGGRVTLIDHETAGAASTRPAIVSATAVAAALILVATVVATVITRSVNAPLRRAVSAAERLASGDFTAPMGSGGPDALSQLGEAVDDMAERLEYQERDRNRLMADIVHEIATPVSSIVGYAAALADGTAATPEQLESARVAITQASARLDDLLAGLRDLSQVDIAAVAPAPVDLHKTVTEGVQRLAPLADAAGVELHLKARRCTAVTDSAAVETVVENLLTNAIRYTPRGGTVTVTSRQHGDDAIISVADTGVGIDPADQRKIFDALYRSDAARSRTTGGAGLGLSIARRAARVINAGLQVESTPGRGSTFTLTIPRLPPRSFRERHRQIADPS